MDTPSNSSGNNKVSLSFDLRVIVFLLLAVIVGMILVWRPWMSASVNDRVVQVTGEAKITDTPDEFVFSPTYEFVNSDKPTALSQLAKKHDEVVSQLKKLGVADNKIKTNSNNYNYKIYPQEGGSQTYSLQMTITVAKKDLADKVQNYLVSTTPSGEVSPQASFSDAKRKHLESKARDEATKDARKKADQQAKNLGFGLGKVKSVSDSQGFGIRPLGIGVASDSSTPTKVAPELSVQPGENDLTYSVTVVYYIR